MIDQVLKLGNGRMGPFHEEGDDDAFERVLAEGLRRDPVDLQTDCLMHNHWHLAMRPRINLAIGRLMGWVSVTHVRRHHENYHDGNKVRHSSSHPGPSRSTGYRRGRQLPMRNAELGMN